MSRIPPSDLLNTLKQLRVAVFDFDGVFTSNEVLVREDGVETVICSRSDGYGMRLLDETGVAQLILSTEKNPVVLARAKKLNIEAVTGIEAKGEKLKALLEERKWLPSQVAFVGNDVNDLPCFREVGLAVAVGDAYPEVKQAAKWVLSAHGGKGAIREFCELVYRAKLDVPLSESVWLFRERYQASRTVSRLV